MQNSPQPPVKIAIIEDDRPIAAMYTMKLKAADYDVSVAYDGEEGLELCQKTKPNLILLDIKMPQLNGDEMLQKLRETDWGSDVQVVVLTNVSKDEAPSSLKLLNVDRYIVKAHHTPSQVVDVVREVLAKRATQA